MRFLQVHNYYQLPGGEDEVFANERALLESHGHTTVIFERHNNEIRSYGLRQKLTLPLRTTWATDSYDAITRLLDEHEPDIAVFYNPFPLVSPAAYYACQRAGVPVVQFLNNARLLCPGSNYYRDRKICKDCLGRQVPWPGALHGCYRQSRLQTAAVVAMLGIHNLRSTFHDQVNGYIVATEFYRQLFIEAGYDAQKLFLKPHFAVHDGGCEQGSGTYALFVGRLAPEKGADLLPQVWADLKIPLKIRGDGELLPAMQRLAADNPLVEIVPRLGAEAHAALIRNARFLVWPSAGYYETFGRVAIEAFVAGVPVIASAIGANAEIVRDGVTGLHFRPGDAADLRQKVQWAWETPAAMRRMGEAARAEYRRLYTPEMNYRRMMEIYETVLQRANRRTVAANVG